MKISKQIIFAIDSAIRKAGNALKFSRITGIEPSSLSRYLNGERTSVSDNTWEKLYPHIQEYLSERYSEPWNALHSEVSGGIPEDPKTNKGISNTCHQKKEIVLICKMYGMQGCPLENSIWKAILDIAKNFRPDQMADLYKTAYKISIQKNADIPNNGTSISGLNDNGVIPPDR